MVCDVAEMASGVGLVCSRRDGAGVPGAAVVPSALSVSAVLVPVDVAVLSSSVSDAVFVLVPSSALSVSLFVVSNRACCSALS